MTRVCLVLLVASCYQPRVPLGGRCSIDERCPIGQLCVDGQCDRPGGTEDAAIDIDASMEIDAPKDIDAQTPAMWSAPTPVLGVNTNMIEDDPSGTPDHLTIVFTSNRNGTNDLFIGTRENVGMAFAVTPLNALNTANTSEGSPEISPDGRTIYFTSDRVTSGNRDVFVSRKVGDVWSQPRIVPELSSSENDEDVAISPDQLTAMVVGGEHLSIATRTLPTGTFGALAPVPSLDAPNRDGAGPSITNGAEAVYLHAGSVRDLYHAKRIGAAYMPPMPIVELDTASRESSPFISADEHYLMFARANDIYDTIR
jgi:hypothetical protein